MFQPRRRTQRLCSRQCAAARGSRRNVEKVAERTQYKPIYRNGYRMIRVPDKPGWPYEYEHRIVAAQMLGRPLEADEFIHHVNHDRLDNRPENLVVIAGGQQAHAQYHHEHDGYWGKPKK